MFTQQETEAAEFAAEWNVKRQAAEAEPALKTASPAPAQAESFGINIPGRS